MAVSLSSNGLFAQHVFCSKGRKGEEDTLTKYDLQELATSLESKLIPSTVNMCKHADSPEMRSAVEILTRLSNTVNTLAEEQPEHTPPSMGLK